MIQTVAASTPLELVSTRRRGITVTSSGGGGGAFNPLTLSPAGWWDFSTLALADGTAIASINDGSTNARTASQATGANQPLCKTGVNGINGLPVGLFDGVNDVLNTASFTLAQPFTVYAVITGGGTGPLRYLANLVSEAVRVGWNTNGPGNFAGSALNIIAGTAANPKVATSVFNGVSSLVRIDGAQVGAGDAGASGFANGVSIGASAVEQFWNGKIGELLIQPGATVSTAYEAALKAKWGTP